MELGTSLAVVSLTFQIFGGCVQGFTLLSTAHGLGNDASLLRTMLNLEEYSLVQWADKVGLTGPDARVDRCLNHALADQLLGQLEVLLRTEKLRERYKLDLTVNPPTAVAKPTSRLDEQCASGILAKLVSDETKGDILLRAKLIQSKNALPKRLWWAAVDKSKFEALVRDVKAIVQGLWSLLDVVQQQEVIGKVDQVMSNLVDISRDIQGLRELQATLQGTISMMNHRGRNAFIAAGLKATRIQLQDEDPSSRAVAVEVSGHDHHPLASRRDILLSPLSAERLSRFSPKTNDSSVGTGFYSDEPVIVE